METVIKDTVITTESWIDVVRRKALERDLQGDDDTFYVINLGDVYKKYQVWTRELPRVHPFYAVRCNDDPKIVALLAKLGAGFSCVSSEEISHVIAKGGTPQEIMYANTFKQSTHLKYAIDKGVNTVTFDTKAELYKAKEVAPKARLVMRIKPSGPCKADIDHRPRFGVNMASVPEYLTLAKSLGLNVVGISFQVGSGCRDPSAYTTAIADSLYAFLVGRRLGFTMDLLNIGGGFPGSKLDHLTFQEMTPIIRDALEKYFPRDMGVRIIAEPGRFFVGSAATLVTKIICKSAKFARRGEAQVDHNKIELGKSREPDMHNLDKLPIKEIEMHYVVNEGPYYSFCGHWMNEQIPRPRQMNTLLSGERIYETLLWGQTCDGRDQLENAQLPELSVGDWLVYDEVGAYHLVRVGVFNSFNIPKAYHCIDRSVLETAEQWLHRKTAKAKPYDSMTLEDLITGVQPLNNKQPFF